MNLKLKFWVLPDSNDLPDELKTVSVIRQGDVFGDVLVVLNEYLDGVNKIILPDELGDSTKKKLRQFYKGFINELRGLYGLKKLDLDKEVLEK